MVSNSWFIGESIGVYYGYQNDGLWQDTPEDRKEMEKWNANGYHFTPGNVKPKDQDGDYRMGENDRVVLGNKLLTGQWDGLIIFLGKESNWGLH